MIAFWILLGIYVFINLCFIPVQYLYICGLEELQLRKKNDGKDLYENMPAGEQLSHYNAQGNFILLPANVIAYFIYKKKHRN